LATTAVHLRVDPAGSELLRWWDGSAWTDDLRRYPDPVTGTAISRPSSAASDTGISTPAPGRPRRDPNRPDAGGSPDSNHNAVRARNRSDAADYDFGDDDPHDGSVFSADVKSIQAAFRDGSISQRKYRERLRSLRRFHDLG
jgi:hypothetical protein